MRRISILSIHLLAIIVPILLGWGLLDLAKFFAVPARSALVLLIAIGAVAVFLLRIDLNPLRSGTPVTANESRMLLALATCSIALLALLPYGDRHHIFTIEYPTLRLFSRWLGLCLIVIAGVIRILALRELGPQFSAYVTLQPGHRLVQSGIYSRIRHPLYLSLLLAGPGVALIFASQLVWPISASAIVFVANRIRTEEALLAKTFPTSFVVYRNRTSALLPFILSRG